MFTNYVDFYVFGFFDHLPLDISTLPAEMFGGSDFWLETRVNIKRRRSICSLWGGLETETSNFALNGCPRVSKNQNFMPDPKKSRLIPSTLWIGCFHEKHVFDDFSTNFWWNIYTFINVFFVKKHIFGPLCINLIGT